MSQAQAQARVHLQVLRDRVDAHFEAAVTRSPDSFACQAGCEQCCHQRISVFEVEAAPLREALAALEHSDPQLRARVRSQGRDRQDPRCALLVEGRCSVYDQRPLICRSHGLPVALPDDTGAVQVDHCPLNFTETPPPRPSILMLDAVNRPLVVLTELAAPGHERVALAQLAAE